MTSDAAHAHHDHGAKNVSDRALLGAVIVNVGLSVFEFVAGLISGSVALMADALHNTNDAAALVIAYVARRIARKGADERFTFGYRRAELIGAMIQLTALILVGLYLVYEAVKRFFAPEPLLGGWIMAAAAVALIVDIATAWLLWAMSKGSLNVKAAFLHNLTDAASSVAVLIGGAAITWLDWFWVDPAMTLLIAGYILWMSFGLLKTTSRILMQGVPPHIASNDVMTAITSVEGVRNVHHLHIWELDEAHCALEAHVVINGEHGDCPTILKALKQLLRDRFEIAHATIEMETDAEPCDPLDSCGAHRLGYSKKEGDTE
ncbi:MAG: cation diffusion facilitator family transporter [Kiritimatiellia bacterium]|nr:cation diffusion facilitator family transporter [Kiritimatiellia bacterium]